MWKRIRKNYRRLIASLLTMAMVITNAGGNLGTIFAAGETENALFLVEGEDLWEAIQEAKQQGEVFDFSALHLAAKRKSIKTRYEKLLGKKEGAVYALNLEIDESYAPEGTELQVFYNAGTEDVIFLFLNESDLVVDYRVNIDGYETEPVRVNPNTANIETDTEEAPSYAENYEAADMIDDEGKKLGGEVLNPGGTSGTTEEETGVKEEESKKEDSKKEVGDTITDEENLAGDVSGEEEEAKKEAEETEVSDDADVDKGNKTEDEKPEGKEEDKSGLEGEDEKEWEKEEVEEVDTEAEEETETTEADDSEEELLSISRHEAAIVTISVDELEKEEREIEEEISKEEVEEEQETEDETEETEAEKEFEDKTDTREETESETKADNRSESDTEEPDKEDNKEENEVGGETESRPEESITGSDSEKETEKSEAVTETEGKSEEGGTGNGESSGTEETGKSDNVNTGILDKEDDSADTDRDSDDNIKNDWLEMEGQLLEDDDIEILGQLKGKEYDTVTILDHVNARAWKVALEDIEAIIAHDTAETEYAVSYEVNLPEGAEVKGEDHVTEGENLYFAVEPEEGYEILGVYVNGMEAEELERESDLASASDWKGYACAYVVRDVSEDLDIVIEMEEIDSIIPGITCQAETEDAVITVEVPEGAFEEEVEFRAEKIQEEDLLEELTRQAEEAIQEGQRVEGVLAYDLTFVTMSGEEVEPGKPVDVKISFKENAVPEEVMDKATAVSVVHFPEGEAAEVETTADSSDVEELNFQAESFSVRMAVFTSETEVSREGWIKIESLEDLHRELISLTITDKKEEKKIYLEKDIVTHYEEGLPIDHGWAIPKNKNITLDLNGHTLTYGGTGEGGHRLFYIWGTLTIEDNSNNKQGIITYNGEKIDGLICVAGGTLNLTGGTITSNSGNDAEETETYGNNHAILVGTSSMKKNDKGELEPVDTNPVGGTFHMTGGRITNNGSKDVDGGAIYVKKGTVNIEGGSIDHNIARNGGGIYGWTGSEINISGGTICNNQSFGGGKRLSGKDFGGGGVFSRGWLNLTGGIIAENTAESGGGGIYFDNTDWVEERKFVMTGGTIRNNTAKQGEGGGIYFGWHGLITGGQITENHTTTEFDWGGGGIFTQTGVTVTILNVLITGNEAEGFGGGVAGCPSGNIYALTIDGAAIFDNDAKGIALTDRETNDGKTDDQRALEDGIFMGSGFLDYYCEKTSTVYGNMLGGGDANWHGSRDGSTVIIGRDTFARAENRMGLTAQPSPEDKARAQSYAKVTISKNTSSTHGGAIMSNGTLIMGADIDTVDISGTKTWKNDNASNRPASITINLLADGKVCASKQLTVKDIDEEIKEGNVWKFSFLGMPKKDINGNEIVYTIEEVPVSGYKGETVKNGNSFSITNTYDSNLKHISVKKVWKDNDNQDGVRPDRVIVHLLRNGAVQESVELSSKNGWAGSFINLDSKDKDGKDIEWTLEEEKIEGYTGKIESEIIEDPNDADKTIILKDSYIVTNTHKPETISISGEKVWEDNHNQDGKRPEAIEIQVYKNGEEKPFKTVEIKPEKNAQDTWNWTIDGLPKKENGKEISYTIEETVISEYTSDITRSMSNGYIITNTYIPKTIDISGSKIWEDEGNQDGKRPKSIQIDLYKKDKGSTTDEEELVRTEEITPASSSDENTWNWTISNLPKYENGKELEYRVEEKPIDGYTSAIEKTMTGKFEITNTHIPEKVNIQVEKKWEDGNNQDGLRQDHITVVLCKGDQETETFITLSEANEWKGTFSDLDKYENGVEISWKVKEKGGIEGYVSQVSEPVSGGNSEKENAGSENEIISYIITNTHIPETIRIFGTKTWQDNDNQDGVRPESIEILLYANGEYYKTTRIQAEENGDWNYEFLDLPKYEAGKEIIYTVSEVPVEDYSSSQEGFDFTNVHTPGVTSRTVQKIWLDSDNQDGLRPEFIQVQLLANGEAEGEPVTLNEANEWKHTWEGLQAKANGQDIHYTVAELGEVPGYSVSYSEDTFLITNRHTPAVVSYRVRKIWDDANNRDRLRPESIQVQLLADGQSEGEAVILSAENEWTYTWNDLPEKVNGQNIRYTVAELGTFEGYTTVYSEDTFTITNTHTVPNRPGGGGSSSSGGGGTPGGSGGGNAPGGPGAATTTIDEPGVPLANLPTESMTEIIEDPDVPLAALPKTGDSRHSGMLLMLFGLAGLGMLFTAAGLRKSKKNSDD